MSYFEQFARWPKKSLIIYAKYDLTFLPEFSRDAVRGVRARIGLDHKVVVLPCGHYTTGETPFKYHGRLADWRRSCERRSTAPSRSALERIATPRVTIESATYGCG